MAQARDIIVAMPRRIIPTVLTLCLLVASSLAADVLLTKRRDADELIFQGRVAPGAENQKVEIWIGLDRVRRDDGRTAMILRLDQKKLYFVNHADRTWSATDLRQEGARWTATATYIAGPGDDVWRWHAKTEPTSETRKVGSWQAARHRVSLSSETGTAERHGRADPARLVGRSRSEGGRCPLADAHAPAGLVPPGG
jgi:hypothetical protein